MIDQSKPPLEELAHHGVKGMKWGVRKKDSPAKQSFADYHKEVEAKSLGNGETVVISKNGDQLTVTRGKIPRTATTIGKVFNRDTERYGVTMEIKNKSGKQVGSFQVWREGKNKSTIRGEWLEIEESEQGKGYSKAALFGMMETARRDPRVKEVRLQVPTNAPAAKHIYSDLGFKKDFNYDESLEDWVYKVPKEREK